MALKNSLASLGKLAAGAGKGAGRLSEKLDDLMFVALKIAVLGVAGIAVYKYAGLKAPGDDLAWYMLFGLGIVAIGFEYYGAQTMVDGWFSRSTGALVFGAALCAPALAFSYSNAIGSAAVQQSQAAGLQKAEFRNRVNTENNVKDAEFALKTAQDARSKLTPARSAADARATIDSAQAHKWWKYTDGCAKPPGKDTRKWCDTYRSAQADLKMWDDISVQDSRIGNLQAKLEDARAAESEAPATISEVRADVLEYAALFGTTAEGGQTMQARHVALTITLFVTVAGFLTGWRSNRGRELKPWGFWLALKKKWHRLWDGDENLAYGRDVKVINNHTVSVSTDRPFAQAIARNLGAPGFAGAAA